jgi:hypothetical protein
VEAYKAYRAYYPVAFHTVSGSNNKSTTAGNYSQTGRADFWYPAFRLASPYAAKVADVAVAAV